MKQLWIGVALLAVLLVAGLLAAAWMGQLHGESAAALEQAARAALEEDWHAALTLEDAAKRRWEKSRKATAALADHSPLENIGFLFAQLEVYGALRDQGAFAACCVELRMQLLALEDAHRAAWDNIL